MPIYVYRCAECGEQIEKRQSFSDSPLAVCESCGGHLARLIMPAPVIFKGSGWYITDHRSNSDGASRNGKSQNGNGDVASGGESPSGDKSEKAGAPEKAASAEKPAAATKAE